MPQAKVQWVLTLVACSISFAAKIAVKPAIMRTSKCVALSEKLGAARACRRHGPQRAIIWNGSYSELCCCPHNSEYDLFG
jgi:hypothetical protein